MRDSINGKLFIGLIESGLNNLGMHKAEVNDLNVFPVPDGDTGTNMYMTLSNGLSGIKEGADDLNEIVSEFKEAVVLGARGNSGVIMSQFLYGACEELTKDTAYPDDLVKAFAKGVERAYGSVLEPTEGTMLTVLREASKDVETRFDLNADYKIDELISLFLKKARVSLEKTPELLSVLKDAGVVDSGGAGIVYIFEGFEKFLAGETVAPVERDTETTLPDLSFVESIDKMIYGYCTELLILLDKSVRFDEDAFKKQLLMLGESVVLTVTGGKLKLHVHTFKPEKVLGLCHNYGEFLAVKVENMDVQNMVEEAKKQHVSAKKERSKLAVVAVSPDKKLGEIFIEMGASEIVEGGDTFNPSVSDFISAYKKTNADNILVYPNNSNVLLTAMQSANAYTDGKVFVIDCTGLPGCYSTLTLIDYLRSAEENKAVVEDALSNVTAVAVTKAIRNSTYMGEEILLGEYVAISGKTLLKKGTSLKAVAKSVINRFLDESGKEVVTLFAGKNIDKAVLNEIVDCCADSHPFVDIGTVETDNPIHELIISLE